MRRAVFIDKDGTLVENVPYNVDPGRLRLTRGAGPALAALHGRGFGLVVVSNQPGIAEGRFPADALAAVQARLGEMLAAWSVPLAGFYYCPHAAGQGCPCRKPAPGLLAAAARDLDLSLPASWLVGDILDDVEAGRAAGCRTILLDNGGETEWQLSPARQPHFRVRDLREAARVILGDARPAARGPGTVVARHGGGGRA